MSKSEGLISSYILFKLVEEANPVIISSIYLGLSRSLKKCFNLICKSEKHLVLFCIF